MPFKSKKPIGKPNSTIINGLQYAGLALSFGLTLGVQIFALGYLLGGYLDNKLASAPWFLLLGTLIAIGLSFRQLFLGLNLWQKRKTKDD